MKKILSIFFSVLWFVSFSQTSDPVHRANPWQLKTINGIQLPGSGNIPITSFPGFGTSHTTAAYGDHNHTGIYAPVDSVPWKHTLSGNTILRNSGDNVGIGTTTPTHKLDVAGGQLWITEANPQLTLDNTASNQTGVLYFRDAIGGGDARIQTSGGNLSLRAAVSGADALTVITNGNVGIGTTAPTNKLDVSGYTRLRAKLWVGDSAGVYSYINPGDANWTVSSSEKLKTNIKDIDTPNELFSKMLLINPKTYNFKPSLFRNKVDQTGIPDSVKKDNTWRKLSSQDKINKYKELVNQDSANAQQMSQKEYRGFLAEEINKQFFGKDSKEINYTDLIIILWKSNQALITKYNDLEARVKVLESKLK